MKPVLIFLDRDGTIDYDRKLHLGHQRNWKSKVRLLPGVVKGMKVLQKIPNSKIYMITNQSGVAVKDMPLLTPKRANDVCKFVIDRLKENGVRVDDYELCGFADKKYVKTHPQFKFDKRLVKDAPCRKPKPGMLKSIMKRAGFKRKDVKIYVVGDRYSDVKTALNIGGFGVFVPFVNEPGQDKKVREKVRGKDKKKVYLAKNFLDVARFIRKREG